MPLGLSGCCQDRETLFRDVFSFLMTVTGDGAGGRQRQTQSEKRVSSFMVRFSGSSVPSVASWPLSMVLVCLIQFTAQWGPIKGAGPKLKTMHSYANIITWTQAQTHINSLHFIPVRAKVVHFLGHLILL